MYPRFRPLLIVCLFLAFSSAGGGSANATELFLTKKYELVAKNDAAFLESVAISFKKNLETLREDFSARDLFFVKADLNGDGVEEFLISPRGTYHCRNKRSCLTSVYMRSNGDWKYAGTVFSIAKGEFNGQFLTVEKKSHNGWRYITDGKKRYCWVNVTSPNRHFFDRDYLGMPMTPKQAGYFWSVRLNEDCTEHQPPYQ